MASENNGQTSVEAFLDRLMREAFDRARTGEPGKTPAQVRELMKVHARHMENSYVTFERQAELTEMVSALDLNAIEDPAIRRMNGKMAESLQAKLTDVEAIKAFTFQGYRDATQDAGPDAGNSGNTPPPAPSGP